MAAPESVDIPSPTDRLDRARGALVGLAIGDALGMATELSARADVLARHGRLRWYEAAGPEHPLAPGRPAGSVTDDTAAALAVADELRAGGEIDGLRLARRLAERLDAVAAAGQVVGPATRRALAQIEETGSIEGAGRRGETNGAAMRIAPVGIATPADPVEELVARVVAVDRPTHDTTLAHAGACAVACAVSAALDGLPADQVLSLALAAAAQGARHGHVAPGADVGARIAWAVGLARGSDDPAAVIDLLVGTSPATQESVPAAFAVAALHDDPWEACLAAASLGGDADTIAAMTGAMVGARCGLSAFPAAAVQFLDLVNPGLGLVEAADALLALRG